MTGNAERLVMGFSYSLVGNILSTSLMYIAGLLIISMLGPEDYGLYQLVFVVPGLLAPILNLGIENTLIRFVSSSIAQDRYRGIQITRFLFILRVSVSVVACLLVMLLAPWIAEILYQDATLGIRFAGMFLLADMLYLFIQSLLQAFFLIRERTMLMVLRSGTYVVAVLVMIQMGMGYLAPIIGSMLAAIGVFLLGIVIARRNEIGLFSRPNLEGLDLVQHLGFAAPSYATLMVYALFLQAGVILIHLAGLPLVEIGYFRSAFLIIGMGSFVSVSLNVIVFPYVSELESKGDTASLVEFCSLVIKLLILLGTPAFIGLYLLSEPILATLLPRYMDSRVLIRILSPSMLLLPIFTVSDTMLMGLSRPKLVLYSNLCATITVVVVGWALTGQMGSEGIAIAYVIGMLAGMFYSMTMLRRIVRYRLPLVSISKVFASTVLMGVAVYLAIGFLSSSAGRLIMGFALALVIYPLLVFFSGALDREDIEAIRTSMDIARQKTRKSPSQSVDEENA